MPFSVLDRALSEELLMRSFDLSYNDGLLIFCKHSSEFLFWQNNFITQLSDNSLPPFSLKNGYKKDDYKADCPHPIEKWQRKTRLVNY